MADGRDGAAPGFEFRRAFPWADIFRCFQVALDPRKLLVAAAGIFAMSFGWWLLSVIFWKAPPDRSDSRYSNSVVQKEYAGKKKADGTDYNEADLKGIGDKQYARDMDEWKVLDYLAGPGGRLRTMPWYEYRGPNPYLLVTGVISGTPEERQVLIRGFLTGSLPVLVEPLVKLLIPVSNLVSPNTSFLTRVYLLLAILWFFVVWGFAGGVITRLAAVQLTGKDRITMRQAVRFVATRYLNYLLSPMIPLAIIGAVLLGLIVYGLFAMIPVVGDIVLLGLGLPLIVAAGVVMAVFLVGLLGYPLMYTTLSVEGDSSDTFDALSRSINYVYQAPWNYIWYWLVAVVYGAAVTFFVLFFVSLAVYMGKWGVGLTASTIWSDRKPDFIFLYAPESFGWRQLLLEGSPAEVVPAVTDVKQTGRPVVEYVPRNAETYAAYRNDFGWYNTAGAGIAAFWLALLFLMMLGFSYSFFWSAATMIYLLMRQKVDEAELDEVFLEDDEPEAPLAPPKPPEPAAPSTSLPVLSGPAAPAPVLPPPAPVAPPASPPATATLPFSPPASEPPAKPGDDKPANGKDKPTA